MKGAKCGGHAMTAHTCPKPSQDHIYFYYRCSAGAYRYGAEVCDAIKHHCAEELEARVWETVSGLLKEPSGYALV